MFDVVVGFAYTEINVKYFKGFTYLLITFPRITNELGAQFIFSFVIDFAKRKQILKKQFTSAPFFIKF